MKRRTFCTSSLGALDALTPAARLLAATGQTGKISSDLPAVTLDGGETVLTKSELKEFRKSLRGQLLLAGDDGYEAARTIWNGVFDRLRNVQSDGRSRS